MVLIVALIGAAAFIRMRDSLTRFYEQHYVKLSEYSERATAIVILMQIILVSVEPRIDTIPLPHHHPVSTSPSPLWKTAPKQC